MEPGGKVQAKAWAYLGETTNNVAEYRALVMGLERAAASGVEEIEVRMDSELVVRQLTGTYKVRHPGLKPLYNQALALLQRFKKVNIIHVGRELNRLADSLANRAIDTRRGGACGGWEPQGGSRPGGRRGGCTPEESPGTTGQGAG